MKSWRHVWQDIVCLENLFRAAKRAGKGKRGKPACAAFEFQREREVLALHRRLLAGSYTFGPYRKFQIREPKPRSIAAAPYPDRVIHHALVQVLEPRTDPSFIFHSYACRKEKGTHRALAACRTAARRYRYVLKLDVRHYYASIDHEILMGLLLRRFPDRNLEACFRLLLASFGSGPEEYLFCRGDDLFASQRPRGIPIGNLTSQFFANVYLDGLDHYVTETLRPGFYLRYMDDMLVFGQSREEVQRTRREMAAWLESERRLHAHARKTRVCPVSEGVPFVGFRVEPDRVRLLPECGRRFTRRLRWLAQAYAVGEIDMDRIGRSIAGWAGHAGHGDTRGLVRRVLGDFVLPPRSRTAESTVTGG